MADEGDSDLGHVVLFNELTGTDTTIECESYYFKWIQPAREAAARDCILPPSAGVQLLQAYFWCVCMNQILRLIFGMLLLTPGSCLCLDVAGTITASCCLKRKPSVS